MRKADEKLSGQLHRLATSLSKRAQTARSKGDDRQATAYQRLANEAFIQAERAA